MQPYRQRHIDEPLPLQLLSGLILLAGYFCVYQPAEAHLDRLQRSSAELQSRVTFGNQILNRHTVYEHRAEQMRSELAGLQFDADDTTMMATFLNNLDTRLHNHHLELTELTPNHDITASGNATSFTLHLRGNYHELIAFLNELSDMPTLVRLENLSFTSAANDNQAQQNPVLDANINAALVPIQTQGSS